MKGKIRSLIDDIIAQRSKGDPVVAKTTLLKINLKGVRTENYTSQSEDDPVVIRKLTDIAKDFGVSIRV